MSLQSTSAVGGLFSSTTNFDPFEITGMMQCSLASALASDLSITTTPTTLIHWHRSGTAKILAQSPTKLYEVLDGTPWTTLDKTTEVVITGGVRGAIIYKGKYVYSLASTIRASTLASSDILLLTGKASDGIWHPLVSGADGNLYEMDYGTINKITSVTGTAGNSTQTVNFEDGMYARHAVNDGRYLVILADNNPTGDYNTMGGTVPPVPTAGNYRCQILFWDMVKGTFDQIYNFNDSYLIGGAFLDGGIYVFSGNGIYVTNIATPPRQIFSFKTGSTITEKPQNPFQITQAKNSIFWTGQTNGSVYAYGSLFPGMKKVFYQPFSSGYTNSAVTNNGTNFYIGTTGTDNFLRVTGTGSTRNTGSVITAPIVLPRPYRFEFVKVVLQQSLASSESVTVSMSSQAANEEVYGSTNRNFSTVGARQTLIFDKSMGGTHNSTSEYFEDFQLTVSSPKAVARVEVWATPQEEYSQAI